MPPYTMHTEVDKLCVQSYYELPRQQQQITSAPIGALKCITHKYGDFQKASRISLRELSILFKSIPITPR